MYKFVLVANVILQAIDAKQLYLCMYGPDANGEYFEEVVNDAMRARSCQDYPDFCLCQEIQVKYYGRDPVSGEHLNFFMLYILTFLSPGQMRLSRKVLTTASAAAVASASSMKR